MTSPKISKQVSIREIQTGICGPDGRPRYSTGQTMVYRLEAKGAEWRIVVDCLRFFEGRVWPFLEHSIAMGKMTMADLRDAERYLRDVAKWGGMRV